MVIYADVLLAVNGWIDFLLLLGVARMGAASPKPWRFALGAGLGGCAALVMLLPTLPWWAVGGIKLLTAAGMILVTFGWGGYRAFLGRTGLLFLLSAAMAGLAEGLYYWVAPTGFTVANGTVYYPVPPLLLVAVTAGIYLLLRLADRCLRRRAPADRVIPIVLSRSGVTLRVNCLYDSGHDLSEPFTGRPVIILSRRAIAPWEPIPHPAEEAALAEGKYRLIPFSTLTGGGVLTAFVPDGAWFVFRGKEIPLSPCYVAVSDRLGTGDADGLIGRETGNEIVSYRRNHP